MSLLCQAFIVLYNWKMTTVFHIKYFSFESRNKGIKLLKLVLQLIGI